MGHQRPRGHYHRSFLKSSRSSSKTSRAFWHKSPCSSLSQGLLWAVPVSIFMSAGILTPFLLASANTFKFSIFIQNAQSTLEDSLDLRPPPLDGLEWPGGDLSPNPKLILQTWRYNGSHRSGRDPRLAPLTCRLYHVCQYSDSAILLPESMRGVEKSIRSCGITNYVFARQASPSTRFDHSHAMMDLVAPRVPPGDEDPEGQLLHASQIIFGQHISQEEWSSSTVDYRTYNSSGLREERVEKDGTRRAQPLTPLLYSRPEIDEGGPLNRNEKAEAASWETLLHSQLQRSMDGFEVHSIGDAFPGYGLGNEGDVSSSKSPLVVCYRSIMTTGEKGDELPRRMMGPRNPFFERNEIKRHTRWLSPTVGGDERSLAIDPGTEDKFIDVKPRSSAAVRNDDGKLAVLVVRDRLSKLDVDAIVSGLRSSLNGLSEGGGKTLLLSLKKVDAISDAGSLFSDFQAADVVIAAHGQAMNNILYMRTRSLVIEVFPYSFSSTVYSRMSDTLGISYVGFMARADSNSFIRCLDEIELRQGALTSELKELKELWINSAYKFHHGFRKSLVDLQSTRSSWRRRMPEAASCAKGQKNLKLLGTEPILRAVFDRGVLPRLR